MQEGFAARSENVSAPDYFRMVTFNPTFHEDACTKCMQCLKACGLGLIRWDGEKLVAEQDRCRNCRSCVNTCSQHAIEITMKVGGPGAGHLKKDYL